MNDIREQQLDETRRMSHPLTQQQTEQRRSSNHNRFISPLRVGGRPPSRSYSQEVEDNDIRMRGSPLPLPPQTERSSRFMSPATAADGGGGSGGSGGSGNNNRSSRRSFPRYDGDREEKDVGLNRSSYSHQRHLRGRSSAYDNNDDYEEDVVGRLHLATPPLRSELRSERLLNPHSSVRSSNAGRSRYYS